MKLTVFQAGTGDCLLLEGEDGTHVLVDGGVSDAYRAHVAPYLAGLTTAGCPIDVLYVSHFDADHIGGVTVLLDDLVAWRVYDYQRGRGNSHYKQPKVPRPPDVRAIWQNAFSEVAGQNEGEISHLLAATSAIASGSPDPEWQLLARMNGGLAESVGQAIHVSHRISPSQLNIPLNAPFGGHLASLAAPTPPMQLGGMSVWLIGPTEEYLAQLRTEWQKYLDDSRDSLKKLAERDRRAEGRLGGDLGQAIEAKVDQVQVIGDIARVTTPNLASIMLFVEEHGRTLLLTGDGHWQQILDGLERQGLLAPGGNLHVNVLKVQHHGSSHNIHADFCRRITADAYVFCANGDYDNPDDATLDAVFESRCGSGPAATTNPAAAGPFVFRFSSRSTVTEPKYRDRMKAIEERVERLAATSNGRLSNEYLESDFFELAV